MRWRSGACVTHRRADAPTPPRLFTDWLDCLAATLTTLSSMPQALLTLRTQ